jgi:cysteine-rich repeat protein
MQHARHPLATLLASASACTFSTYGLDLSPGNTDTSTLSPGPGTNTGTGAPTTGGELTTGSELTTGGAVTTITFTTSDAPQDTTGTTGTTTSPAGDDSSTGDTDLAPCGDEACSETTTTTDREPAECGNGKVEAPEECDDGNAMNNDACIVGCKAATCGDGFIEQDVEQCDDKNTILADMCWPTCEFSQCGFCEFTRPNVLFLLDYSSSTNELWTEDYTRYTGIISALTTLLLADYDLMQRVNVALVHYGHDPDPQNSGTKIGVDQSGIVDGQKIDLLWSQGNTYLNCQHEKLATILETLPSPSGGNKTGIGTWTKGALERARAIIQEQRNKFFEKIPSPPFYRIILITDGKWTNPQGNQTLAPADQNPAPVASTLYKTDNVTTYVIALGDAEGENFSDELAMAGGTGTARDVSDSASLLAALQDIFNDEYSQFTIPKSCSF